jgi:hypothetical protein
MGFFSLVSSFRMSFVRGFAATAATCGIITGTTHLLVQLLLKSCFVSRSSATGGCVSGCSGLLARKPLLQPLSCLLLNPVKERNRLQRNKDKGVGVRTIVGGVRTGVRTGCGRSWDRVWELGQMLEE